jgi:predicted transposase YdaD
LLRLEEVGLSRPANTKPYDQAFKYLAEKDAEALLILLGDIKAGEHATVTPLPREVSVAAQLPDQPYEVISNDVRRLVHVEAQTTYNSSLHNRMTEYGVRLWLKYRLPLASYLLLLSDRGVPKNLRGFGEVVAGGLSISLRFRIVKLWTVPARSALRLQRPSLLPFIPLMNGSQVELEKSAGNLGDVVDEVERRELSLHFLLLGGLRYNKADLLELVTRESMIPLEQLRESSFYQYIVEEGLKEGVEKGLRKGLKEGLKKGMQRGRQEGMKQGQAALLRRQLQARFGKLPKWALGKIAEADSDTLDKWGLRVLRARSLKSALS